MKAKYTIYEVTPTHFLIGSSNYPQIGSVTVMFFDGEWWVSHSKWADEFLYTSKSKSIARAKEMIANEIYDIKYSSTEK